MRPTEAAPGDWSLYYDQTWMLHNDRGPVYVRVDGRTRLYTTEGTDVQNLDPEALDVWWPRGGAYNSQGTAIYVGRRSRRSMKKSANNDCYYILWGRPQKGPLGIMAKGYNFLSYNAAKEAIDNRVMDSVALTRDIIIAQTPRPNSYSLLYKGQDAGYLSENDFIAHLEGAPAAKLARIKLNEEGIIRT